MTISEQQDGISLDFRAAAITPGSINEEDRTVDVVFATAAPVERWAPGIGRFLEVLDMSKKAIDFRRLNAGAPFLNAHSGAYDALRVMGAVVRGSASTDGESGTARIKFDSAENDPDAERVFQKIKRGILTGVSVGYRVLELKQTKETVGELPVYRATKWEPYEISVAPIPADLASKFRSQSIIMEQQENPTTTSSSAAPVVVPATPQPQQEVQRSAPDLNAVRAEERARITEIEKRCQLAGISPEFARTLIDSGESLERAAVKILDEAIRVDSLKQKPTPSPVVSGVVEVGIESARSGISNAILVRGGGTQLTAEGREWVGMSMLEMARRYLELKGHKLRGLSNADVAREALGLRTSAGHSTSDFPNLLADVSNKSLADAYGEMPASYLPISRREVLRDFKATSIVTFGDAPALKQVVEGGEYQQGTISEGKETYRLGKYGRRFVYTWELLVNDDLNALTRLPSMFARKARILESDLAWAQITGNPTMGDGVALFHATHGNLVSATAFGEASLTALRLAIRKQKSAGPDPSFIGLQPSYVIGGVDLQTKIEKELALITYAGKTTDVNPFGGMRAILEPRLNATEHYMAVDPSQCDVLIVAGLAGEEGPVLETRTAFESDGFEIKCRHVFAAKVGDFRGIAKNPGA